MEKYIIGGIIIIFILIIILIGYVKAPPDMAFIISGAKKKPKVLIGRAGVKIPVLERLDKLYLGQISVDIKTDTYIPTNDFINVKVDAIAKIRIKNDEEGLMLPKSVSKGKIIKQVAADGSKRYDFQFENTRGYKITVEGLSEKFNPEYWNYAKLISGVLRYRMPIEHVIRLVASLQLKDESINTWKNGVERALKKYLPGQADKSDTGDTADTASTTDL